MRPVVIAINSAFSLLGPRPPANEAVRRLIEVARRADIAVEVLITIPWSTNELGLNSFVQLYMPGYIDGD